jgi:hypothetical protein
LAAASYSTFILYTLPFREYNPAGSVFVASISADSKIILLEFDCMKAWRNYRAINGAAKIIQDHTAVHHKTGSMMDGFSLPTTCHSEYTCPLGRIGICNLLNKPAEYRVYLY